MERVDGLLNRARGILVGARALTWAARGLAIAAAAGFAIEVLIRFYPIDPVLPELAGCALLGLVVASGGWVRAWPSRLQVARLADVRLGGRERLSTAVEFAAAEGFLVWRQRADAGAWAAEADAAAVSDPGWPVRSATRRSTTFASSGPHRRPRTSPRRRSASL
ncbi:MAG: hypothetical protein E6J29_13835 [Chloroflexi bacterium]|nr:MAG: hypothetical protein E6J29_13835 [Chloroflexota bacterium]